MIEIIITAIGRSPRTVEAAPAADASRATVPVLDELNVFVELPGSDQIVLINSASYRSRLRQITGSLLSGSLSAQFRLADSPIATLDVSAALPGIIYQNLIIPVGGRLSMVCSSLVDPVGLALTLKFERTDGA